MDSETWKDIMDMACSDLQDKYIKMDGPELRIEAAKPGMADLWFSIFDVETIKIFIHKMEAT